MCSRVRRTSPSASLSAAGLQSKTTSPASWSTSRVPTLRISLRAVTLPSSVALSRGLCETSATAKITLHRTLTARIDSPNGATRTGRTITFRRTCATGLRSGGDGGAGGMRSPNLRRVFRGYWHRGRSNAWRRRNSDWHRGSADTLMRFCSCARANSTQRDALWSFAALTGPKGCVLPTPTDRPVDALTCV